jgi:hypothetical protein
MSLFVTLIYGLAVILIIYFVVRMLFLVYYTPGIDVIYNSPQAQQLFPNATNKLFPTWGYNKAGMYSRKPFKHGQGSFWPESGQGYKPNKFGYPGPSPSGGLRQQYPIPAESEIGYWGQTPQISNKVNIDIYDNSSQEVKYITPIGHWTD